MATITMSQLLVILVGLISLRTAYGRQTVVKGGYWIPDSGVEAADIDSTLFTHLFCAFAHLNPTTFQLTIPSGCTTFTEIVQKKNPSVKTLLSIGGGSANRSDYNRMASQESSRKTFIDSAINLARSNGFHGLDLDWEQQNTTSELDNLGALLNQWRPALIAESSSHPLLLSAAVAYSPRVNSKTSFPAQIIAQTVDWINIMAYDFYTPGGSPSKTHSHSALRNPRSGAASGSEGISAWINAGVPSNRLVLGFPFYGYVWKLKDPDNHGILAPADGVDTSVVGSGSEGQARYTQIKEFINQKGAKVEFDSAYVANYCYSGTTWIGYDDTQTISAKVSYAKTTHLLGYFAWFIAQDDNWALSKAASQAWGA